MEKVTIQERANLKKAIQLLLLPLENFPLPQSRTGTVYLLQISLISKVIPEQLL